MNDQRGLFIRRIADEQSLKTKQVENVISMIEEGNTVPFIARYRKEQTGAMDEVQIRQVIDRWEYIKNLSARKDEVSRLIEEQGKMTEELAKKIAGANKLQEVEDLYRPYRQKRRTKASVAKENGLEPFAEWMLSFPAQGSAEAKAKDFLSDKVATVEEAISGARDIIAEMVSDDAETRK